MWPRLWLHLTPTLPGPQPCFPSTSWYQRYRFWSISSLDQHDCRYKHEFRRYTRQQIMEVENSEGWSCCFWGFEMCNMGMAPMDPCGPTKLVTLFLDSPVFWGIWLIWSHCHMWVASPANFHLQGWRTARYQVMTSGSLVWWMGTGLGRRAWSFRTGFGGTFRLIDFEMPEYCSLTGANAPNTSISFLYLHINIVFPCYFQVEPFGDSLSIWWWQNGHFGMTCTMSCTRQHAPHSGCL